MGNTLFWVNLGSAPAEIRLRGFKAASIRIYTEDTLQGDTECGRLIKPEGNSFTAPAASFGYALSE